jgi:hypothetical protein
MLDTIIAVGIATTKPTRIVLGDESITTFRLESTGRRTDPKQVDRGDHASNEYTIVTHGSLATSAETYIEEGDRIVVVGRVQLVDSTDPHRPGTSVEVEAYVLSHDLGEDAPLTALSMAAIAPAPPVSTASVLLQQMQDAGRLHIIPVGFKTA